MTRRCTTRDGGQISAPRDAGHAGITSAWAVTSARHEGSGGHVGLQTLVLWDVDHTLMETGGVGFELFRAAFEQATGRELEHPAEVTGRTEPAIFRETVELQRMPYSPALFDRYAALLSAGYVASADEIARRGRALPGAVEAIAALASTGRVVQSVLTATCAQWPRQN